MMWSRTNGSVTFSSENIDTILDWAKLHGKFYPVFACPDADSYGEVLAAAMILGVEVGAYIAYRPEGSQWKFDEASARIDPKGKTQISYFHAKDPS